MIHVRDSSSVALLPMAILQRGDNGMYIKKHHRTIYGCHLARITRNREHRLLRLAAASFGDILFQV